MKMMTPKEAAIVYRQQRKEGKVPSLSPDELAEKVGALLIGWDKENADQNQIAKGIEEKYGDQFLVLDYEKVVEESREFWRTILGPGADKPIQVTNQDGKVVLTAYLSAVVNNDVDKYNLNLTWYEPNQGLITKTVAVDKNVHIREAFLSVPEEIFPKGNLELRGAVLKEKEKCKAILQDMEELMDDANDFMGVEEYIGLEPEVWKTSSPSKKRCPICGSEMLQFEDKVCCTKCNEYFYN